MKIEMVPAIESESAEDQTKVMRLKVTGPIDPADAVLRRARELVQRTGSTSMGSPLNGRSLRVPSFLRSDCSLTQAVAPTSPRELIAHARSLLKRAYAPYSHFPVAAVVVDAQGRVFEGVNVENASYGLTICAERVAIFSAIAAGATGLSSLAVTAQKLKPVTPCGACRQVIAEFLSAEAQVHSDGGGDAIVTWSVGELLPHAFEPRVSVETALASAAE